MESVTQYIRNPDLVTRQIAGETLLVPITGELANLADMFSLNDTGAFVWECLAEPRDVQALSKQMSTTFEVSEPEARSDITELLTTLLDAGLVQEAPAEAAN